MERFIVSARKYRPQTFDTVVGQSHVTTTLKNAIKNQQLAHAFLFCGPRGVGKTTCARILAKTINCEKQTKDGEACNKCNSCISFNEGTSLNIHELDAASNNSVDDIRTLVEQVRFAPQAGKYKVYIIDEVHMLSSSAFNAFLKTLEEPPPYAIFILATTEKHKILPTILSRCQIFDFKRITLKDTVDHLKEICKKEEITADNASLQVIAQKSEGCMRDALSILDKIVSFTNGEVNYSNTLEHLNILDADYYFRLIESMQKQDLAAALLLYDDINRKGFEGDLVLNGFAEFLRNLLVCKDEKAAVLLEVVESFRDKYVSTAKGLPAAFLISALNIINEAEVNYKAARNKRLHVELAFIKLTYLQQAIEFSTGEEAGFKKKLSDESKPVAFKKIAPVAVKTVETSPKTKKAEPKPATAAKLVVETQIPQEIIVEEEYPDQFPIGNEQLAMGNRQQAIRNLPAGGHGDQKASISNARLGQLQSIRQQYAKKNNENGEYRIIPLNEEKLLESWKQFTQDLKNKKNPAAQSFDNARLKITSETSFEVITNNNLEQKFIEQERRNLNEFLQPIFNNKMLLYTLVISDEGHAETTPTEKPLSTQDQFRRIAEQYPLVKELKDRLRLELDY
jgi:DNA polymerase III subunit gamma/tau